MLHEVLLALAGHGGLLVELGGEGRGGGGGAENARGRANVRGFLVPEVLSKAEAASVAELARVGDTRRRLEGFVQRSMARRMQQASLMLHGLCLGVREALEWQLGKVVHIERLARKEPGMPLSRVKYLLGDADLVLEAVLRICEKVEAENLVGGKLLRLVHEACTRCGVASTRARLERVLMHCNKVLFNMLEAWMVHGILLDDAKEFFVQQRPYKVSVPRQEEGEPQRAADQGQHPLIAEYEWKSQFRIRDEMLPTAYLSRDLADKVLFVGKAVRVLQRSSFLKPRESASQAMQAMRTTEKEFVEVLQVAKDSERLDMMRVGKAIQAYYLAVALELQNLVVSEARLVDHLSFAREFFLLGRGEFFTSFIQLGRTLFNTNPRAALAQAQSAVNNGPWREAAVQSGVDDWPQLSTDLFAKVRLVLSQSRIEFGADATASGGFPGDHMSVLSGRSGPRATSTTSSFSRRSAAAEAAKTSLSELVLVGDASIATGVLHTQSTGPGGVWAGNKVLVERGFNATCTFRHRVVAPSSQAGRHAAACCIQHDPWVGPTALGEGAAGLEALENALVVVAEFSADLAQAELRVLLSGSGGELLASGPQRLGAAQEEGSMVAHRMHVQYMLEGESRIKMMLQVDLYDEQDRVCASVKGPLDISHTIDLERGSGRAWTGVILSSSSELRAWTFTSDLAGEKSAEFDPWRTLLNLRMDVDWPLHLVLTQNALDQYGMMFRFLLCLKRVGASLKEAWAILNQTKYKRQASNRRAHRRLMMLWRLRSAMAFLVNNLQFHLQVDVIDSLEKELQEAIDHAKDFMVVAQAHEAFMEHLISRSFLHNKVVRNTIDTVLRRCLRFCNLVERFARVDADTEPETMAGLDASFSDLSQSFSRDSTFFYALLTRINSNLLLRVDFNSFFEQLAKGSASFAYEV